MEINHLAAVNNPDPQLGRLDEVRWLVKALNSVAKTLILLVNIVYTA